MPDQDNSSTQFLTAHGRFYLVLLCSQPDTVRRFPLRKTEFHHYSHDTGHVRPFKCILFPGFCQASLS